MEKVYKASVLYDFKAKEAVQLTVYRNDIVTIQDATPSGWCLARHKGKLGWIPKTYVRRMGGQKKRHTRVRTCGMGHELKKFETDQAGFACDVCGTIQRKNATLFGCRACNFDACPNCFAGQKVQTRRKKRDKVRACPKGHGLTEFKTNHDRFTCDVCKSHQQVGATLFGCRACNFDACPNCFAGQKARTRPGTEHKVTLTLYHGSDSANTRSILKTGLKPSKRGRLGPGVYLTDDKKAANAIAQYRGQPLVCECRVDVGKVYDFDKGSEGIGPGIQAHWARYGYDTATSVHPLWHTSTPFREYCVSDKTRITITSITAQVSVTPRN